MPQSREEPEEFAELCAQAVRLAAQDLGLRAGALAPELAQGEIALLVGYLRAAAPHVPELELRTSIDALLHRLTLWTDGED